MTKRNPKSKSANPIKLYSVARVNQVLIDEQFIEWRNKNKLASSKRKKPIAESVVEPESVVESVVDKKANVFDFNLGSSALVTSDWVDFSWEHFGIEDDSEFSDEEKLHAVTTVKKMLSAAYWFPPQVFFDAFSQVGDDSSNTQAIEIAFKDNILANGWRGIPLVTFMIRDRQDNSRVILDSAAYKWNVLKDLFEQGRLPSEFRIPIFDLKRLRAMVRDKYKGNLEFSLKYAISGGKLGHEFALREIARNWLTSFCTGIED